ncbi:uncharacterized protein M6B38_331970 [Iris pallida]|uniref:Uncharacterized protein n=1 Tax=Iris pallida TaxID=29817 RepID=A0AAX6H4K0_IRIPA|nr:uncharacterized protein M6B38_331970 [Iris pallida]
MVQLFLSRPESDGSGDKNIVEERISLLQRLESILWSVITSAGRYEARLWLCNTISCIHSITARDQHDLFVELLRSKQPRQDLAAKLLHMIFEKRPERVGPIIANKSSMLENFFEGNPRRILQWFDNFASAGESEHRRGSRAISQFAFVNRDICWEELEWKGKHGQSPAVVATKPHYFHDLDVLQTIENFLEYVPDFWSSSELAESVKDGEILSIDVEYFVEQFVKLMYVENSDDVWALIDEFLLEEQFSCLSQKLLVVLDECWLLNFLRSLAKLIHSNIKCNKFKFPACWLEILLATCNNSCVSLDELLLLNAVITQGRQILRLISDEEHIEEKESMEELLRNDMAFSTAEHWSLMKECQKKQQPLALKLVGLQSWLIHYYLSRECKTPQNFELMFVDNGINFRKADEYSLVRSEEFLKEGSSDVDKHDLARGYHRKRKRDRKKRMKKYVHDDSSVDELVEFETLNGWQGLQSGRSWLLSTDGYSCAWNMADIPEHLSRLCFMTWMKWVCSKW